MVAFDPTPAPVAARPPLPHAPPRSPDRWIDLDTFPAIMARDRTVALAMALRICGSHALAEEVVQEAMFAAWRDRASYDPGRGSTRTWVLRIVHNRAVDAHRHEHRRHGRDVSDDDGARRVASTICVEADALQRDLATGIRRAMARIPAEQRHAILLTFFADMTHLQVAGLLGLAPGTIKGRIRLGLDKLRTEAEITVTRVG